MTPKTPEQYAEIREAKKALILESALELFAEEGYHSTSISMIAKKAGISKGLLYNYFESKDELIKTIVFDGMEAILKIFDTNKDGILTKEEFRFFIDKSLEIIKSNINYWKLYFSIVIQPTVLKMFEKKLFKTMTPYYKMLEEYFKTQGFKKPAAEAAYFIAMLDGVAFHSVLYGKSYPLNDIKEIIINRYKKNC